jgi:hypothetical protein
MSRKNDNNNNDQNVNQRAPFSIPSKETVTGIQIGNLLNVVDCLANNLRNRPVGINSGAIPMEESELDKGVKFALETSVIRALTVLDSVVDNAHRWNVDRLDRMERAAEKYIKANVKFLKEQAASAAHIRRPCFRFQPRLVKVTDGSFAAFIGDMDSGQAIVGQGQNIEEALRNFDSVCNGKTPKAMTEWVEQQQQIKNEHNTQVDPGTIDAVIETPSGGKNAGRNRRKSARRRLSGAKQTGSPPRSGPQQE